MGAPQPEHTPRGDPCKLCRLPARSHRRRTRERAAYFRAYNATNGNRESTQPRPIIAIDGEGYTLRSGAHRYVYMAAVSDRGELVSELRVPKGVHASQVWAWLLSLPSRALLVGYSLGYDRTKWIESWPDDAVWRLCRPECRKTADGIILPVEHDGYKCNLVATRFSVKRAEDARRATVWDLFKFFQSSFVKALKRWDIGTEAQRRLIEREKKRRGSFKGIGQREREYCVLECELLAKLARALIEAHEEEGLNLKSYFGPGSTASIILRECGAKEQRSRVPAEMLDGVMSAYFGGRFETAWVGPIKAKKLYAYDLASAYPWALAQLPCLRHGRWVHRTGASYQAERVWLGSFRINPHPKACLAWGPLPHRLPDGNILFPVQSAGGWAWGRELRAAIQLHPGIELLETWTWVRECECPPPFKARVEELYQRRLSWGKAARGIVLKLGLNSLYGKSAQRVGKGRFRCMVRAGLVTSLTRARLLEAVALAKDPWNILELATDSILSREPLPIEGKGLGAWERKPWPGGVFLMRPGMRFALESGHDEATAARGLGVATLNKNREKVVRSWSREPLAPLTLATPSFFHGAKLSVRSLRGEFDFDEAKPEYVRAADYGRWTDETRQVRFTPKPKRESVGPDCRLYPWSLPLTDDARSCAYGSVTQSALADELDRMRELEEDQPDAASLALV